MALTLALLIPALLILLLCWLNRNLDAPEDQPLELRHISLHRSVFIFGVLGFSLLALLVPVITDQPELAPGLAGMALFASLLAPFSFISAIRYGTDGLTIRTFFGRVHALRWEDVTLVQDGSYGSRNARQDGYIIAAGRKFYVNYAMPAQRTSCAGRSRNAASGAITPRRAARTICSTAMSTMPAQCSSAGDSLAFFLPSSAACGPSSA